MRLGCNSPAGLGDELSGRGGSAPGIDVSFMVVSMRRVCAAEPPRPIGGEPGFYPDPGRDGVSGSRHKCWYFHTKAAALGALEVDAAGARAACDAVAMTSETGSIPLWQMPRLRHRQRWLAGVASAIAREIGVE